MQAKAMRFESVSDYLLVCFGKVWVVLEGKRCDELHDFSARPVDDLEIAIGGFSRSSRPTLSENETSILICCD